MPYEQYFVETTPYVPGSVLPVIVYRGVLAKCENEDQVKESLEANGGWVKGVSLRFPTSLKSTSDTSRVRGTRGSRRIITRIYTNATVRGFSEELYYLETD